MKFLLSLVLSLIALPAFGETIDFHKDVASILREYCAGCPNDIDLEGEFSVKTFKTLMKGGESGAAIQPGKADGSLLIKAVTKKVKPYMPPRKEPQLTTQHIATLTAWINSGAKGPSDDHSILATLNVPKTVANKNATRPVTAMAVASNGQLAVGRYGEIQLGDKALKGIPGKVNAIAISPDAKWLAVASGVPGLNGVAVLFDLDSGDRVREFSQGHRDALYGVAFSPDGQRLGTAGYDRLIQLWDAKTGKLLNTLKGHNGAVYGIAFSPDGKILAAGGMKEAKSNAFCPGKPTVLIFDWASGKSRGELRLKAKSDGPINGLCFLEDGSLAGYGEHLHTGTEMAFWDPARQAPVHALPGQSAYDLDLHPDGRRLLAPVYISGGTSGNGAQKRHREKYSPNGTVLRIYNLFAEAGKQSAKG